MTYRMRCIAMSNQKKDVRSRKWLITINNPMEHGYSRETIKDKLLLFKSCIYWCISDEVGKEGTPHTHIYMACKGAVRFSTILKHFKGGHFDVAKGTSQQNKDYVFKEGKWADDEKQETNLKNTHEEWGEMPIEKQGKRTDIDELYEMVKNGMSNVEILEVAPQYMFNLDKIDRVRQTLLENEYKNTFRSVETTYVFGKTGTGKTRDIMEANGYDKVFRITDYDHPFDGYKGQNTIVFEEFRSSLKIQDMLNYLDGYPLELPCRYSNKIACFTQVYIVSNWELGKQYEKIQSDHQETWKAFLRRIKNVKEYTGNEIIKKGTSEYLNKADDFVEVEAPPDVKQIFEFQCNLNDIK